MTPSRNGDSRQDGVGGRASDASALSYQDAESEALVRAELSEPDSEDYRLASDCLSGEASPEDRELYEVRKRTDPRFRELTEWLELIEEQYPRAAREPSRTDLMAAERTMEIFWRRVDLEEQNRQTAPGGEKRARWRRFRSYAFTTIGLTVAAWLGNVIRQQWVPVPSAYVHADAPMNTSLSAKLPDETQVTLVPGSHLSYSQWFGKARDDTLILDGEGTFTVAPGGRLPLVVAGPGVEVKALAGQFSIEAFAARPIAYVKVHEGRAEVRPRTRAGYGEELMLQAGEGAVVGPELHIERMEPPITAHPPRIDTRGAKPDSGVVAPRPVPKPQKRSAADHQEFLEWPADLAPRAPALADSIERDFGERPYAMLFVGRDTMHVYFWNPRLWRGDQGPQLPEESLPLVRKAARHVAAYVLDGFGKDAGVNVVILTFIRARLGTRMARTVPVPAQEVTTLYSRKMFEPQPREFPTLSISER